MRTSNPALKAFGRLGAEPITDRMTVRGTVNKTLALIVICTIAAATVWNPVEQNPDTGGTWIMVAAFAGLVVAIPTIFVPKISPWTAPLYALLEGVVLGGISALLNQDYPGIALAAGGLTLAVALVMFTVYRTGLIKVTNKFRFGVIVATGGIFLFYLVAMIASLFGASVSVLNSASPLSIGISVVIVGVAALNLLLDFDFIEKGAEAGAPRFMEWYGAFSLLVTLVWLYLEILRLLAKIRSN